MSPFEGHLSYQTDAKLHAGLLTIWVKFLKMAVGVTELSWLSQARFQGMALIISTTKKNT